MFERSFCFSKTVAGFISVEGFMCVRKPSSQTETRRSNECLVSHCSYHHPPASVPPFSQSVPQANRLVIIPQPYRKNSCCRLIPVIQVSQWMLRTTSRNEVEGALIHSLRECRAVWLYPEPDDALPSGKALAG